MDLVPKTNWTVSRFTDFAARNATSLNTIKKYIFLVIYDEMESNLAQIKCVPKSIVAVGTVPHRLITNYLN